MSLHETSFVASPLYRFYISPMILIKTGFPVSSLGRSPVCSGLAALPRPELIYFIILNIAS